MDSHQNPMQKVYGRRLGRPLNAERQSAMDEMYPDLGIDKSLITEKQDIDPYSLYKDKPKQIWLEIGFGNGEHLHGCLLRHPEYGFIGAEPFVNGMAAFLKDIRPDDPQNVRVWMNDAIRLICSLQSKSIDRIYVLNPDPWPKTRHHKRRIINPENLNEISRVLKPGGDLVMATDVDDLAVWMTTKAINHPDFEWAAKTKADWQIAPENWIHTRYETKGQDAGRKQSYLFFKKTNKS